MSWSTRLGAGALAILISSVSLIAGNEKNSFTGSIGFGSPCEASFFSGEGPFNVMVTTNTAGTTPLVSVHVQWKLNGSTASGTPYQGSFIANAEFDAVKTSYVLPYHSVFVGHGGSPNFKMDGMIKVFVNASGFPTGAGITSFTATCQ